MLLIGSKDILEITLSDAVTSNQLSYYTIYTENSIQKSNYGLTNDTSNVRLVQGSKNNIVVNSIIINNLDTVTANVKIQILSNGNRLIIYNKIVKSGEQIQYNGTLFEKSTSLLSSENFMEDEVPTGTIDGVNSIFTITTAPLTNFRMYLNGIRLLEEVDFTLTGTTLTMINIPFPGDIFVVSYYY